ncbi:MAG TPA: hypothetical protein VIG99_03670 [Myxococcaceae bacterium]|jgi:hypothetical protein
MTETTEPRGDDGDDDGTVPHPDATQIDTKPPKPKPMVVFLAGFIAGLLVGGAIGATCGGGMMAGRQMASTPTAPALPNSPPAPTQPPTPQ